MRPVGHGADAEISVVTDRGTYQNSSDPSDLKTHQFHSNSITKRNKDIEKKKENCILITKWVFQ